MWYSTKEVQKKVLKNYIVHKITLFIPKIV